MAKPVVVEQEPDIESVTNRAVSRAQVDAAVVAIAESIDAGPLKQIPRHKMKDVTPWNPEGKKRRLKLTRIFTQNDYRCPENRMTEAEIELVNKLKPGKYYGGKWIVTETDAGGVKTINLYVPNKSREDQFEIARIAGDKGLAAILERIVNEAST
jgi:hypothetical protein